MGPGASRHPAVAALLSALCPGLGQFYNRQWGKGAGFLLGVLAGFLGVLTLPSALFGSADPDQLRQSAADIPPESLGQVFTLALLALATLALAIWSIVDAARSAKKSA